jgi:hypothetical protein
MEYGFISQSSGFIFEKSLGLLVHGFFYNFNYPQAVFLCRRFDILGLAKELHRADHCH